MDTNELVPTEVPETSVGVPDDDAGALEYRRGVFDSEGAYLDAVKRCQHVYRAVLDWVGIRNAGGIDHYIEEVGRDLDSGEFFLTRIGRIAQTDPALVIALLVIRMRWIEEFQAVGSAEKFLIDQTLIAFYHQLRIHEMLGNAEARAEAQFFGDQPLQHDELDRRGLSQYKVDEYLSRLAERLLPALERCQRMAIRSLRELRMSRITRLTIQHVSQLNLAQQQLVAALPVREGCLTVDLSPTGATGDCLDL
ncbi:MAG: hypothetical protein BWY76_02271 [bacterium ADurb.Bin429]|nr:MAG: hypothetical protein BWY76_02271 [bacterium ADurb.Bin429]